MDFGFYEDRIFKLDYFPISCVEEWTKTIAYKSWLQQGGKEEWIQQWIRKRIDKTRKDNKLLDDKQNSILKFIKENKSFLATWKLEMKTFSPVNLELRQEMNRRLRSKKISRSEFRLYTGEGF